MVGVAVHVLRRRASGGALFAIGAAILLLGMLATSFDDGLLEISDDSPLLLQVMLLADALIFAAAMATQALGLRGERDAAVRAELRATQERQTLAESLLEVRRDRDRARSLAETHCSRLALTGHDLRQPLTSLHLALEEAEAKNPELGRSLRGSLDYIRGVLNTVVIDIRPEEAADDEGGYHTAAPDMEEVEVELLLANAVRMFTEEAHAKGLSLTHEPTELVVETETVTVIRILSNLVSNAVKYTKEGGVSLRAHAAEGTVSIEVRDTGPGMDAAEITQIRGAYSRGTTAGNVAGDGLGLSSVERFAQSLGLALVIESESEPGRGSRFVLERLPAGSAK